MTKQLQEALYIQELIFERENIKYALSEENIPNLWVKSAFSLPNHFHSEDEPTYLELLSSLDGFSCHQKAPKEAIDTLREYVEKLVDENVNEIITFLEMRLDTIKENIKYQKKKFKKDWSVSYKESLSKGENLPIPNLNMDAILDKINEKGINSLSEQEKRYLKSRGGKDNNSDNNHDSSKH